MRYLIPLVFTLALLLQFGGCISMQCSQQQGERNAVKTDTDQKPTTPISTTATIPFK